MHNKTILVTGASGFIGKALVKYLSQDGYNVRGTVRSESAFQKMAQFIDEHQLNNVKIFNLGDLSGTSDWYEVLPEINTIVHCAARAHILNETHSEPLKLFRQINCHATENLIIQAQEHNVKRIIFISSIGVLGNTSHDKPFTEYTIPNPELPYALSKLEAEQTLLKHSNKIEAVIIRPPLVYGPEVKGNFQKLLSLIDKGYPLPFGRIKNKRQFIGLDNLIDFIATCIESPNAANQTFLVADDEVVSTTDLIKLICTFKKKKIALLPIPAVLLNWLFKVIGREKMADQLLNNLEIQTTQSKDRLQWSPPFTMHEQMKSTLINTE